MRHCIALAALLAVSAHAQAPAGADPEPAVKIELAKAVQRLDAALQQLNAADQAAREALLLCQGAELQAKSGDLERLRTITAGLNGAIQTMVANLAKDLPALRDARDLAAVAAPAALIDPVANLREKTLEASKLTSIKEARARIEGIEKELTTGSTKDRPGASKLLGLVRYRLADVLRQQVAEAIGKDDTNAERLLVAANRKFREVFEGEECTDSGEGTSLRAVAIRRAIQGEAALYDWYRRLARSQPTVRSHPDKAEKCRVAANALFRDLGRLYPDERLPDNRKVLDAARSDVERIFDPQQQGR